jgi:hypothetical protein
MPTEQEAKTSTSWIIDLVSGLVEKFGAKMAGCLLILAGCVTILPIVFPVYIVYGIALVASGIALIAFGQKLKKASDQFVSSEAEKRIANPSLPSASTIPAIQREIEKKLAEPGQMAMLGPTAEARATGNVEIPKP